VENLTSPPSPPSSIVVQRLSAFEGSDINDICDAAEAAIADGGGFGWLKAPPRHVFEAYWRGVLLVPERELFVGRLDGVIAGAAQLVRPPRNNEAQSHTAHLTGHFVAPWARGHGLARGLTAAIEDAAREAGYRVLNLDVRETQVPAIAMYEARGFTRWGTHPRYALVDGSYVAGHYYTKEL
jgi:ribosomal protein S18 acetylase RimI-like enzyme